MVQVCCRPVDGMRSSLTLVINNSKTQRWRLIAHEDLLQSGTAATFDLTRRLQLPLRCTIIFFPSNQGKNSKSAQERFDVPQSTAALLPLVHDSLRERGEPLALLRAVGSVRLCEYVADLSLDRLDGAHGRAPVAVDRVAPRESRAHFDELVANLKLLGDVDGVQRLVAAERPEDAAGGSVWVGPSDQ